MTLAGALLAALLRAAQSDVPERVALKGAERLSSPLGGFADRGADHLDRLNKYRTAKRLARRLDALGYDIMLRPKVAT